MHPISASLDLIKAKLLSDLPSEEAPLVAWQWICGQKLAEITKAVSFKDGALTIETSDDSWCRELQGMSRSYLRRFDQILPGQVMKLRFQKRST